MMSCSEYHNPQVCTWRQTKWCKCSMLFETIHFDSVVHFRFMRSYIPHDHFWVLLGFGRFLLFWHHRINDAHMFKTGKRKNSFCNLQKPGLQDGVFWTISAFRIFFAYAIIGFYPLWCHPGQHNSCFLFFQLSFIRLQTKIRQVTIILHLIYFPTANCDYTISVISSICHGDSEFFSACIRGNCILLF